jgi:hypothetical protein
MGGIACGRDERRRDEETKRRRDEETDSHVASLLRMTEEVGTQRHRMTVVVGTLSLQENHKKSHKRTDMEHIRNSTGTETE